MGAADSHQKFRLMSGSGLQVILCNNTAEISRICGPPCGNCERDTLNPVIWQRGEGESSRCWCGRPCKHCG